jgi:hypothetical protein
MLVKVEPGSLAEFKNFEPELIIYADDLSEEDIQGLGQKPGSLSLHLNKWPTPVNLSTIIQNKQKLDLGAFKSPVIDLETAIALSSFKGEKLYMSGISEISDESAKILTALTSNLKIANVDKMSDTAIKTLLDSGAELSYCGSHSSFRIESV